MSPIIEYVDQSLHADVYLLSSDVRHLPDELDDAVANKGNADELVGKSV